MGSAFVMMQHAISTLRKTNRRGDSHRFSITARASAPSFTANDVVVVYDRNSKVAGEVVVAVEKDSAMAPKKVDYAVLPSSDASSLAELARQRGLTEKEMKRLTKTHSASAVLPSGALIQNLELDPWPLLRELRYRTCLEYPKLDEWKEMEEKYFVPLRSLKGPWWKQPEALDLLAKQLDEVGFVIIDDFLPENMARAMKASNMKLYEESEMQEGATTGGSERVGIPHRGDVLKWIGYDGESEASRCVSAFVEHIEQSMLAIGDAASMVAPEVARAVSSVKWRSETMLTCYPGKNRARYFRHTDNSSGNGRLLTALVYLNENWQQGDGGELRLFYPGEKNLKVRMEVEPLWNRLLLFWSDDRSPHEVLSTCKDRFAATVWFYDQTNPTIPLTEVGSISTGSAAAPAPLDDSDTTQKEAPETPAAEVMAKVEETAPGLILFYDGSDAEMVELSESLDATCRQVDLRSGDVEEALRQAGEPWVTLLADGADAVIQEAGPLFLCLPNGEVLKNGQKERWMLEYELNYWKDVKPPSDATRQRLEESLWAPLQRLKSGFAPTEDVAVWWAAPEAVSLWGQAMARESFAVLDDFLPPSDARALASAIQRLKPKMSRGQTDSELSASGRGDMVLWVQPDDVPEMGRLVEFTNALITLMMELPQEESIQARTQQITALSDAQLTSFPGSTDNDDARYIRHVDNEDGRNGRLITCTFYLNEDWDAEKDGGEIRLFEPDQQRIKADVAPKMNRLVIFFSDSSVPHEVRRCRRERYAVTTWYINQEMHLAYHQAEEVGQ